jgi:CubicO group peptidase (beta-lactamase class C family)
MTANASIFPRAAALIEQGAEEGLHHGAQCYASLEGACVGSFAYGEARPDHPMTDETVMLWMSAAKPLTAVAVGQLVEAGEAAFDDSVTRWLPAFAAKGKSSITVRHLLEHTAGLRGADREWQAEEWDAAVHRLCAQPVDADWTPGAKAGYHIEGTWYILGALIEKISGLSFCDYVREYIFDRLELSNSYLGVPAEHLSELVPRLGYVYQLRQGELVPHPFANRPEAVTQVRPAGNGRGPARELGRFYEDLLAGWQQDESALLKQETIRMMTSRSREGLFDETFRHQMDWGLGFMPDNNRYGADTVPYSFGRHASSDSFGHGGAQSAMAFADPVHALVLIVVFNGMPGEPRHQRRMRAVLPALYEDLGLA